MNDHDISNRMLLGFILLILAVGMFVWLWWMMGTINILYLVLTAATFLGTVVLFHPRLP